MKKIELSQGLFAMVSDKDYPRLSKLNWHASWNGRKDRVYARSDTDEARLVMHRYIMGISSDKLVVDHRDGNTLNNTRRNLRVATVEQNNQNKTVISAHNTTGFRGVVKKKTKKGDKFLAIIYKSKKLIYLGTFDTAEQAAKVFDKAAKKLFGRFCGKLNFGGNNGNKKS